MEIRHSARVIHNEGLGDVVGLVAQLIHAAEEVFQPFFLQLRGLDRLILGDYIGYLESSPFLMSLSMGVVLLRLGSWLREWRRFLQEQGVRFHHGNNSLSFIN